MNILLRFKRTGWPRNFQLPHTARTKLKTHTESESLVNRVRRISATDRLIQSTQIISTSLTQETSRMPHTFRFGTRCRKCDQSRLRNGLRLAQMEEQALALPSRDSHVWDGR